MLSELRIRQFTIINSLDLEFSSGLNVITGETGSGKSVILEALGILLGDRALSDTVRNGADAAELEGLLETSRIESLEEAGIPQDGEVVIRRLISRSGKNRIYINGILASARVLKAMGDSVADIHGQFEHQSLLMEEKQLELLDKGSGLLEMKNLMRNAWRELKEAEEGLDEFQSDQRERAQREDMLRFQVKEIEEAGLVEGEEEGLEEEMRRLSNMEKLTTHSNNAYQALYGDVAAGLGQLNTALAELEAVAGLDESISGPIESLKEAIPLVDDAAREVRAYRDGLQAEPDRLDNIIGRIEKIKSLKRKYGSSIGEILEYLEQSKSDLSGIENYDHEREILATRVEELRDAYFKIARKLSSERKKAARKMEKEVVSELGALDMSHARFFIKLEQDTQGPAGLERARFMISANPGESEKPISAVASGGELSRIMLAIKSIMGSSTPVLVFDEVDAGIGGKTADAVGRRLKMLAKGQQVICVTHLPQIASYGDHHIKIDKEIRDEETLISADVVRGDDRIRELARMLSGSATKASLTHARELIKDLN